MTLFSTYVGNVVDVGCLLMQLGTHKEDKGHVVVVVMMGHITPITPITSLVSWHPACLGSWA